MPHWPKFVGLEPPGTPSERARTLLAKLGHPEKRLPPVVHVGGTKGKGSIIAFLRTMLTVAGYKVHAYTSPHIARFNERILLAGHEITDETLHSVIEETRVGAGDMPVGFFDATTVAAMLAFAHTPADILLMEMGLGGTVDATNIIDDPLLTVLSTVSYDHMEYMGNTLASIAAYEAGLFKPNVPCVVSYQHSSVWPVLHQAADAIHTPLHEYGKHWQVRNNATSMIFADTHGETALPLPSLLGAHQLVNAGAAIAALSVLEHFHVSGEAISQGLKETLWKGRLTKLASAALPPECELWFDGGHNMAAGQAIALYAREHWQDRPLYMIFGSTKGKSVIPMLEPFAEIVQRLYGVAVKSEPKSYSAESVISITQPLLPSEPADSIRDALRDIARRESRPFRVLVFGSLYLWLEATQS